MASVRWPPIPELIPSISFPSLSDILIISYPANGGKRAIPNGRTVLDLKRGVVERPDGLEYMSSALETLGYDSVGACFMWVDSDIDIEPKYRGASRGRFVLSQCNPTIFQSFPIDKIELNSGLPFNIYALFSSAGLVPQLVHGITGQQERYGEITTVDTWQNVTLGPTEGGELASAYRKSNIQVNGLGAKVFLVHNTGANDAEVNLQLLHITGKRWVNSVTTGSALNIPNGDNARIEDGTFTGFVRLRARSRTAGSHSSLECQYRGFSGIR